jgi:GNAT superfamily N-acetyltransferase
MASEIPEVQVDNSQVRVTRWTLSQGEQTGRHRHEHDYVVVPLADAQMSITAADGTRSTSDLRGGSAYFRPAGVDHTVANEQDHPLDFVEVELRAERGPGPPPSGHAVCRARPLRRDDEQAWRRLYRGYADFYGVEQTDEMAATVWGWVHDAGHEVSALVAEDPWGQVVGLAHYRPFARPLSASVGCWLDDLFVDPAARGTGAVDALLGELGRVAAERGWSVVRWITADDNHRARSKYDKVATRTQWVTYDMAPQG